MCEFTVFKRLEEDRLSDPPHPYSAGNWHFAFGDDIFLFGFATQEGATAAADARQWAILNGQGMTPQQMIRIGLDADRRAKGEES